MNPEVMVPLTRPAPVFRPGESSRIPNIDEKRQDVDFGMANIEEKGVADLVLAGGMRPPVKSLLSEMINPGLGLGHVNQASETSASQE